MEVSFDEFEKMMGTHIQQGDATIRRAWAEMDVNGDGELTRTELQQAMSSTGMLDVSTVEQLMEQADQDHSGTVSFKVCMCNSHA